jgi:hypothetical protein
LKIYGLAIGPSEIDAQAETWDGVKSKLHAVAQEVVASDSKDAMVSKKVKFISALEEFCAETIVMNRELQRSSSRFRISLVTLLGRLPFDVLYESA